MNKRIFGLETEFAVIPSTPSSKARTFHLFIYLEWAISSLCRTMKASYRKLGFFLENGSLINYEARATSFLDSRIIETATCECTSPREVVTYQRALEDLLLNGLKVAGTIFPEYRDLTISKSSIDWAGNTFGCHENYYVRDKCGVFGYLLNAALLVPYLFILVVFLGLSVLSLVCISFWCILYTVRNFREIAAGARESRLKAFPGSDGDNIERVVANESLDSPETQEYLNSMETQGLLDRPSPEANPRVHLSTAGLEEGMAVQMAWWEKIMKWILRPLVMPYSILIRLGNFRPFVSDLTSHLITRTVLCGAGHYDDAGFFRLSQKAGSIDRVAAVYFDEPVKPVFDLKNFLYNPLQPFNDWKQLQIMFSDSNMNSFAEFLKVGSTTVVIQMIEDGVDLADLRLADPISALNAINGDLGFSVPLPMKAGGSRTVLQIQRALLDRAREHVKKGKVTPFWVTDTLQKWDVSLKALESGRFSELSGKVDWATKLVIMHNIVPADSFALLRSYVPVIRFLEVSGVDSTLFTHPMPTINGMTTPPPEVVERALEMCASAGIEPARIHFAARGYFALKKVDFRYHDLDPQRGYQRGLEASGLVEMVIGREDIERARSTPPMGTRAQVRGFLVRRAAETGRAGKAGWRKVKLFGPRVTEDIRDPYKFKPDNEI